MHTSLLIKVFPVVAILVWLLATYYLNNLKTRLFAVTNNEEFSGKAPNLSLLQETTLLNPVAASIGLLARSKNLLDSEHAEWTTTLSIRNTVVESRAVIVEYLPGEETVLPVHRITLVVNSSLSEAELFARLASYAGQECMYPVRDLHNITLYSAAPCHYLDAAVCIVSYYEHINHELPVKILYSYCSPLAALSPKCPGNTHQTIAHAIRLAGRCDSGQLGYITVCLAIL